ncbi:MAG: O-antigen ligase family protein [Pirellulales bacterium]|nr:O-antigen ligase family protein [Pirellulales bacterium]
MDPFWKRVWFGPLEPGWFNFFETAARRFAVFWPAVMLFSITASAFMSLCVLGCWLMSGRFGEKWRLVRSNPVALASLAIGLLSLVGCLYGDADRTDVIKSLKNESNFFIVALCVTLFDKAFYRDAAIALLHGGIPILIGIKICLIAAYGVESEPALFWPVDYVTFGLIVIVWILLIVYRPFSWKALWPADKTAAFAESGASEAEDSSASAPARWRKFARPLLVCLLILFLLTLNRGRTVHLCLLAAAAVVLVRNFRWKELAKGFAMVAALLAVAVACFPLVRLRFVEAYRQAVEFQADKTSVFTGEQSSVGRRLFMYQYGLISAMEHPWLGAGTGGIPGDYDKQLAPFRSIAGTQWQGRIDNPHCEYLTMSMQFGFIGLLGYCAWLATLWLYSSRNSWPWSLLGRCMAAMITLSTVFSSHMSNTRTGCFYALMLAIFFSAANRSKKEPRGA